VRGWWGTFGTLYSRHCTHSQNLSHYTVHPCSSSVKLVAILNRLLSSVDGCFCCWDDSNSLNPLLPPPKSSSLLLPLPPPPLLLLFRDSWEPESFVEAVSTIRERVARRRFRHAFKDCCCDSVMFSVHDVVEIPALLPSVATRVEEGKDIDGRLQSCRVTR